MWILVIILGLLLTASGIGIFYILKAALKISQQNQAWENFYEDTLEDTESVIDMLDQIMNRRQLISDDPDVQNIYRVLLVLHDILIGYTNAKDRKSRESKGQES
jgi:hypothetical protein